VLVDLVADTTPVVDALDVRDDDDLDILVCVSLVDIDQNLDCLIRVRLIRFHVADCHEDRHTLIELLTDQPVVPVMPRLPSPDK